MYQKKSKLRLLKRSEAERKHISIYIFFLILELQRPHYCGEFYKLADVQD